MSESEDTDIIPASSSIVRAPSEITTANSGLAKTVIPSKDSLAKVTYYKLDLDTILDGLIPDPLPESIGKDNAIHHLNIIIFGKPNTGKCLTSDDVVPTTTGSIVRVGNLHPGLEVFSVDENFKLVKDNVVQIKPGQPFRTDDSRHQSYGYYKRFADEFGLQRVNSRGKRIPQSVLRADNESLAIFLSALFAGDGWVDSRGNIGYGTISSVLAHQVQHCLLRFGVLSKLRRGVRALAWDRKRQTVSYEVWVPLEYRPKFEQHIALPERRVLVGADAVLRHEPRQIRRWSPDDFPLPVAYLRSRRNWPGPWSGGAFASMKEAQEFARKYKRPYALKIAEGDCFWPRIKSIEYIGPVQTLDVQVEKTGK